MGLSKVRKDLIEEMMLNSRSENWKKLILFESRNVGRGH